MASAPATVPCPAVGRHWTPPLRSLHPVLARPESHAANDAHKDSASQAVSMRFLRHKISIRFAQTKSGRRATRLNPSFL